MDHTPQDHKPQGHAPQDIDQGLFDSIPVGLIALDNGGSVLNLNQFAKDLLGMEAGCSLSQLVHPDDQSNYDVLLAADIGSAEKIQLKLGENSLHSRLKLLRRDDHLVMFSIENITELVALGTQLKTARQPERKFVHEISNALTTTIGYTELIKMMLEEHEEFSGERLAAIRRYEHEVFEGLKRADGLIRQRRQNTAQQIPAAIPMKRKHVVVVDDERQITEFLSELLKARHYKVTPFTDGKSALEFYKEHQEEVDLVIMDQVMPEMSGIALATELLSLNLEQPIVLCTGDQGLIQEQSAGKLRIEHFLSKPIDINELTEMVSNIID